MELARTRTLFSVHRLRRPVDVQSDDMLGSYEHLVGAQSKPLRLLVLHHQFLKVSDGDLPGRLGATLVVYLHIHCACPSCRECTRSTAGAAAGATPKLGMGPRRFCYSGDTRCLGWKSMGFQSCIEKLLERQQLIKLHLHD